MTDKDKYVDETLKKQIQESFGATDEQLKARMDRIEKTLTDDEFAGVEERMMAKFMARLATEEKKEEPEVEEAEIETVTTVVAEIAPEAKDDSETKERNTDEITSETKSEVTDEISATVAADKKVIRFSRKKVLLVAALAAAIAGALAVTGIGENSYFFREDEERVEVIFDSGKNISDVSSLEDAYEEIKEKFGEKIISLNHIPPNTDFESLRFEEKKAIIKLDIDESYLYFIQWKRNNESSINKGSSVEDIDIEQKYYIKNEWLNQKIYYGMNELEGGEVEYQTIAEIDGIVFYIFGKIEKEEFEKILKNIYFY